MARPTLVTIRYSHFCEKGRWGMDHSGIPYRESAWSPMMSRPVVVMLGSTTTPVLVRGPGVVRGTNDILAYADRACPPERKLYPTDPLQRRELDSLVARLDEHLAVHVRRWFYSWIMADRERFLEVLTSDRSPRQARFLEKHVDFTVRTIGNHFDVNDGSYEESSRIVSEELEWISGLLADGRRYLVGDRFSAADLAFAAFLGALAGGEHYRSMPGLSLPDAPAQQAVKWLATPACAHAARMYRDHRQAASTVPAAA